MADLGSAGETDDTGTVPVPSAESEQEAWRPLPNDAVLRVDLTTLGSLTWTPYTAEAFAKPDTDGRAGRKSLELILGIYESAKTGREVPIPMRTRL